VGRKPAAKIGLDEQESDRRLLSLGKGAMDSEARYTFGSDGSKSGEGQSTSARLTPGGLPRCSAMWRKKIVMFDGRPVVKVIMPSRPGGLGRSQQRP